MFFVIQKSFIENIFRKAFHTPHNPLRNSFSETYFQDTNIATTLYPLCTPYVMWKQKSLTSYSRWCCRRNFLFSTHHHGCQRMSTPLNNTHYTTPFKYFGKGVCGIMIFLWGTERKYRGGRSNYHWTLAGPLFCRPYFIIGIFYRLWFPAFPLLLSALP